MPDPVDRRMELVLWRHAEPEDALRDAERPLSPRGLRQAARVAAWLEQRLPAKYAVYASPVRSARQTAEALGVEPLVSERLGPGATASDVLELVDWPNRRGTVAIVVGHQPTLGRVAAQLVTGSSVDLSIRKGGLWWIARRDREGKTSVIVRAVVSPDFL